MALVVFFLYPTLRESKSAVVVDDVPLVRGMIHPPSQRQVSRGNPKASRWLGTLAHKPWSFFKPLILWCESKGNYTDPPGPASSASGGYQILHRTWAGHAGYADAYHAPPQIQDEKAQLLFDASNVKPWMPSVSCWLPLARASSDR